MNDPMQSDPIPLFADRKEAAERLAVVLQQKIPRLITEPPLVLAIPRGGVATGFWLAQKLKADLDVIVARKLRSPWNAELAIGALAEGIGLEKKNNRSAFFQTNLS